MSKPFGKPIGRYQRSANDKESRILKLWQAASNAADAFHARTLESALRAIKWSVAGKIDSAAGAFRSLSSCDEKIYEYYRKLLHYYNAVVMLCDGAPAMGAAGGKTGEILSGIYSVAVSRLRQFEENTAVDDGEAAGNPIKVEKKMLVAKSVKAFSEAFDMATYRFKPELYGECLFEVRRRFAAAQGGLYYEGFGAGIAQGIYKTTEEKCFERFYELYTEALKAADRTLNDFFERQAAAYYNELLLNEHEVLSGIASVQIPALNAEAAALSEDAAKTAGGVASVILEAYKDLSSDVATLQSFFKNATHEENPAPEDFEEFSESLREAVLADFNTPMFEETRENFNNRLALFKTAFTKELNLSVEAWLVSGAMQKDYLGEARARCAELCKMAADIRNVFYEIYEFFKSDEVFAKTSGNDGGISAGISETVEIKARSLDEAVEAFEAEAGQHLVTPPVLPSADSPERVEIVEEAFTALINELVCFQRDDRRALSALKRRLSFREDNPCFASDAERLMKPLNKYVEIINGKITRFTKEHLLFEISTFEEIMNYSVSRLRESEDGSSARFAAFIDGCAERIAAILAENGIKLIKPAPHDIFNGREHEVLMAEKHEDFKRGEIIKLMNSGYRQGDAVILRANVIASK